MKKNSLKKLTQLMVPFLLYFFQTGLYAQNDTISKKPNRFWQHVQFGGGIGLGIGGGFTNISLAPSAIYNINQYVSVGGGLQGSYVAAKQNYSSALYGGNVVALFNPIPEAQLSIELEQVRVNTTFDAIPNPIKNNFWNTGLFLGAGYRVENVTVGGRYNVLYNQDKSVYTSAFMPFIRAYF